MLSAARQKLRFALLGGLVAHFVTICTAISAPPAQAGGGGATPGAPTASGTGGSTTGAVNNPTGTSVTATTEATVTGGSVPSVVTAGQGVQADPFNPGARAQWKQATDNALTANALLGKAAASGKYNTDKLDEQRMLWAIQVAQGLNKSRDNSIAGSTRRAAPTRQVASVPGPQAAPSQPNFNSQVVNFAGQPSEPAVVVVSNSTSINLRFSNPGIAPTEGAKFVFENVKAGVAEVKSGYEDKTLSPGGLLISRVLNSLREEAKKDAPESVSPDGKSTGDNVRLDENASRGLPTSGAPASGNFEDLAGWTESKKEVLKELLKQALEKSVERTTPESVSKESADSNLLAALKTAGRDPSVFDKLADDIADSVQSLAVNDRQISSFLSKKAAERDRARMAKAFLESGQQPVRAVASENNLLPDLEIDLSNGKGLILLAIASILAVLFWTSRSKKA